MLRMYKVTTLLFNSLPAQKRMSEVFKYYSVKLVTHTFRANLGQIIKGDALCIKKY